MEGRPFTTEDFNKWFEKFEASQPWTSRAALRRIAVAKLPGVWMNIARKKLIEEVAEELAAQNKNGGLW